MRGVAIWEGSALACSLWPCSRPSFRPSFRLRRVRPRRPIRHRNGKRADLAPRQPGSPPESLEPGIGGAELLKGAPGPGGDLSTRKKVPSGPTRESGHHDVITVPKDSFQRTEQTSCTEPCCTAAILVAARVASREPLGPCAGRFLERFADL